MSRTAVAALSPEARSVADARKFARQTLADWGLDALDDDLRTVLSELTTNAVLHAGTPLTVTLRRLPDGVRVEVADRSPVLPTRRRYSVMSGTGRGMAMVESLARSTGTEITPPGKVVWAEIPLQRTVSPEVEAMDFFDFDSVDPL